MTLGRRAAIFRRELGPDRGTTKISAGTDTATEIAAQRGPQQASLVAAAVGAALLAAAIYASLAAREWMIAGLRLNHLWGPVGAFFERLPNWVTNGLGVNFYFGGTSLLIVVGVAMDTINQVESQLVMRHYEGFTPRSGRVRGRRSTW